METLVQIQSRLSDRVHTGTRSVVSHGDCLSLLNTLPDHSVSLILTDPPYHSTKKDNIYGDTHFRKDAEYVSWMQSIAEEWKRILRPNGSVYVFCSSAMSAQLEVMLSTMFFPLNHITWTKPNEPGFDGWKGKMNKEALRRWYPHSERILYLESAEEGNLGRSPLGNLLRELRKQAGLSGHQLTELIGEYGRVNHGGSVSNWETGRNIPSRGQWEKISRAIEASGNVASVPPYEDAVRPFFMASELQYVDVWDFPSVRPYRGKHPAEKPIEMLRHIIEASSYPGDIVLDCFAGSGATGVAAVESGRKAVLMEIDERWALRSAERMRRAEETGIVAPMLLTTAKLKSVPRPKLLREQLF